MLNSSFMGIGLAILMPASLFAQQAPPSLGVLAPKLQHFVDDKTIAGAVMLVGDKDKTLDVETIGYADIASRKPMAPDDFFYIASMSKAFTGAAIMMLVDDGKIASINDPVSKYLPNFKDMVVIDPKDPTHTPHPANKPITIRMILSHSSGLPRMASVEKLPLDPRPLSVLADLYAKTPLVYQPDTDYLYSNAGINTAGRIVEVVSGMPFEQFLQTRIFDPLGMKETTFWPTADELTRLPTEYQETKDHGLEVHPLQQLTHPLDKKEGRYPYPAGGLFSTAEDISHFMRLLLNKGTYQGKRLLSEESVHLMTTKEAATKSYGFGLEIDPDGSYSHGGALQTNMGVDPRAGIVRVFSKEERQILKTFFDASLAIAPNKVAPTSTGQTEGQ